MFQELYNIVEMMKILLTFTRRMLNRTDAVQAKDNNTWIIQLN